jgi:hypothetical protein
MRSKITFLLTAGAMLTGAVNGRAQINFTQITNGAIVNDQGAFTRAVWGDFRNSGFLDLFVSRYDDAPSVFYWNDGNGAFTKLAGADPVLDVAYHTGAAAADYLNDGHLDLVVSSGGESPGPERNLLYHSNGDGTFTRLSGGGVTSLLGKFDACTWVDYDLDGFVDLFITDNGPNDAGGKNCSSTTTATAPSARSRPGRSSMTSGLDGGLCGPITTATG